MEVYKVGGCIRDYLLGQIPKDIDYIVVGSNEEEMIQLGFKKVGADFPVFLCKNTNQEYALARKEKKINKGYNGFISDTKAVSLEDDLVRRDLTINSMAISNKVEINKDFIIDPFGGISDLENRILRPVSSSFKDDPLRILRVARQRAQLSIFGKWTLDASIFDYAKELREELSFLTKERVHKELEKLFLDAIHPSIFFNTLRELNVLDVLFPQIYRMIGLEHNNMYHLEGDVYNHTMMAIDLATTVDSRFATLFHDIGKYSSFKLQGNFHQHTNEKLVNTELEDIFLKLSCTTKQKSLIKFVSINHHRFHKLYEKNLKESKIVDLLSLIREKEFLLNVLDSVEADNNGRISIDVFKENNLHKSQIVELWSIIRNYKLSFDITNLKGEEIKMRVREKKISLIKIKFQEQERC